LRHRSRAARQAGDGIVGHDAFFGHCHRQQPGGADPRRGAIAAEAAAARLEVVVGNAERRGDEAAADIDHTAFGDGDAVRVDEIDLTVGGERAGDGRGRIAGDAISGGNLDRPALKQLLKDIDAGRIDVIVVYKIDRLTRSLADS
jgi:hypothetical protein